LRVALHFLVAIFVALGVLSGVPLTISPVSGDLTGLVCIAASDSTSCPDSSPSLSAPSGTTFSVAVNIQGSDSLDGFDVNVTTDSSVLNPLSIDLSNTVIPASVRFVAVDSTGSVGGVGFAHLTEVGISFQTVAPTTGTLFRINYQVVGAASSSTGFNFQLVQVAGPGAVPESVQSGVFTVQPPQPDFTVSALPVVLNVALGSTLASTITLSTDNGYSGRVDLSATVSDSGIIAVLSNSTVTLDQSSANTRVNISSSRSMLPGDYFVTVTATDGSLSHSVDLVIIVSDFQLGTNPYFYIVTGGAGASPPPSFSGSEDIFVYDILGFTGDITLTVAISSTLRHGPTASLSPAFLFLSGTNAGSIFTLTVTALNNTPTGTYLINVTGTSGPLSHSLRTAVIICRFSCQ